VRRRLTAYGTITTAAMLRGAVRPDLRLYEREALVEHSYLNLFGAHLCSQVLLVTAQSGLLTNAVLDVVP
jgi:hypothetical protein